MNKKSLSKQKIIFLVILALIAGALSFFGARALIPRIALTSDKDLREDYSNISSSEYEAYFLSMYDVSCYDPEEFELYMGWTPYIFKNVFSDGDDFQSLDLIYRKMFRSYKAPKPNDTAPSGDASSSAEASLSPEETCVPSVVYLGVDPMIIADITGSGKSFERFVEKIFAHQIKTHQGTDFRIVFPGYSIRHYEVFSEEKIDSIPEYYERFAAVFSGYENVSFHFPGNEEWIYGNQYIFTDGSDCKYKPGPASTVLVNILASYYKTAPEDIPEKARLLQTAIKDEASYYCGEDLSDTCIVVLGDSIFGLYSDETSIQSIISDHTGAEIICRAIGGAAAARIPAEGKDDIFGGELNDLTALDKSIRESMETKDKLLFIIEFGLNDYFQGAAAENPENPYDTETFGGALRTALDTIKENWPTGEIFIMSPGYILLCDYGEEPYSTGSKPLSEYRKTSAKIAEEYSLSIFDLTQDAGIEKENFKDHCYPDFVHYNELGRLKIGKSLIKFISENY